MVTISRWPRYVYIGAQHAIVHSPPAYCQPRPIKYSSYPLLFSSRQEIIILLGSSNEFSERKKETFNLEAEKGGRKKSLQKEKKKFLPPCNQQRYSGNNNGGEQPRAKRIKEERFNEIFACRNVSLVGGDDEHVWGEGSGCNNNDTPATWKITSLWVAYGLVRGTAARTAAAAKLEQLNRGGAIRFTGELTPAAHCGSALIEIERLPYPPSIPSAILAISEVDCVTTHRPPPFQACSNPSTPSYGLITPAQSEEVKKLTPRFNRRFINYARIEV